VAWPWAEQGVQLVPAQQGGWWPGEGCGQHGLGQGTVTTFPCRRRACGLSDICIHGVALARRAALPAATSYPTHCLQQYLGLGSQMCPAVGHRQVSKAPGAARVSLPAPSSPAQGPNPALSPCSPALSGINVLDPARATWLTNLEKNTVLV